MSHRVRQALSAVRRNGLEITWAASLAASIGVSATLLPKPLASVTLTLIFGGFALFWSALLARRQQGQDARVLSVPQRVLYVAGYGLMIAGVGLTMMSCAV